MGVNFAAGTIRANQTPVSDVPITLACFFRRSNGGVDGVHTLLSIQDAARNNAFAIQTQGAVGIQVRAQVLKGGTSNHAFSAYSGLDNAWHHATAMFTSSTNCDAWINGVKGTTRSLGIPSGLTEVDIGGTIVNGTPSSYFPGALANLAIWGAALSAAEIISLTRGVSPLKVRPSALKLFMPLFRSYQELKGISINSTGLQVIEEYPKIF